MIKKPNYKKLDLQIFATFFEIYSGKASVFEHNMTFIYLEEISECALFQFGLMLLPELPDENN